MPGQTPYADGESHELIAAAARGDRAAFAKLVHAHQEAVMRFARALTRSEAAAEDLFQETFLTAFRRLETYRGEAKLRTWLFTIARHLAGRLSARRAGEPAEHAPLDELGVAAGWGATDPAPSFTDALAARQVLQRALAQLSEEERAAIVLRDLEGHSGEEAAAILGLGLPAFKSRLHRARLRLAALVRQGGADGP